MAVRTRRRATAALLVCGAVFATPGCGQGPARPATSKALRVVMAPEIEGLDPHRQTAHGGFSVLSNVYEALTALDEQMHVVPGLAIRWESPDELTWRFHLRPGVRFHDGRLLQAADVVQSLERARRPGSTVRGGLATVSEVTSPAAGVVVVRTTRPSPMLLTNLAAVFVAPKDAPAGIATPIGTGPYQFVRHLAGVELQLQAWHQYWGATPAFRQLVFLFDPDPERRLERLASGSADVALRLSETAPESPSGAYRIAWRAAPGARVLALRVDRPPFSDIRIRRALHLAIDRQAVAHALFGERARPLGQPLPPGIFGHVPELVAPPRDLPGARRWLHEANGGRVLVVALEHGPGRQHEAEAIAAQLTEAGVQVSLHMRDVPELLPRLASGESRMTLFSFILYTGVSEDFFDNVLHSPDAGGRYGTENRSAYRSAALDALVERANATRDMTARLAAYQAALRIAMDDLPFLPLWEVSWVYGIGRDVEWTPVAHGWFNASTARPR